MRCAAIWAISSCALVAPAVAQTLFTDRFLHTQPVGTLGLFQGGYLDARKAKQIRVLGRTPVSSRRQRSCHVGAAHLEPSRRGEDTFVGFQLIKIFNAHDTPALIHVGRNPGWVSLPTGKPLPELRGKGLGNVTFDQFAMFHGSPEALKVRPVLLPTSVEWHGAIGRDEEDYSASYEHALFWSENPMQLAEVAAIRAKLPPEADKVRVENRLIRFQLTDDPGSRKIPHVSFDCLDPSLVAVVVRAYVPFSTTTRKWGVIDFR